MAVSGATVRNMRKPLLISLVVVVVLGAVVAQSMSFLARIHSPVVRPSTAHKSRRLAAESIALRPGLCGRVNGGAETFTLIASSTLQRQTAVSSSGQLLYPQGAPGLLNLLLPKDFWVVEITSPNARGEVVLEAFTGDLLFCGGSGHF